MLGPGEPYISQQPTPLLHQEARILLLVFQLLVSQTKKDKRHFFLTNFNFASLTLKGTPSIF